MLTVGIDPSPNKHAYAVLREDGSLLAFGHDFIEECPQLENAQYIIEMVACYGMAAGASLFDTCVEIGKLEALLNDADTPFPPSAEPAKKITRKQVVTQLCGSSKGNDSNVRQALIDLFGGPDSIKKGGKLYKVSKDVWAALAIAVVAQMPDTQYYIPYKDRPK